MFTMTNANFLIREPFIKKAANSIRALDLPEAIEPEPEDDDFDVIGEVFGFFGFEVDLNADGCYMLDCRDEFGGLASIRLMEDIFKAISRAVEPGSFLEFSDDGDLLRYVFLYDVVEKWTVPHVLFEKKEAI